MLSHLVVSLVDFAHDGVDIGGLQALASLQLLAQHLTYILI